MKYIAIDYGRKKMGIALSDGLGSMAFAKYVLQYSCISRGIQDLVILCMEHRVNGVVVGLPLYKDGSISPLAREVYSFVSKLYREFHAHYFVINEYLSSFIAKSIAPHGSKHSYVDAYSARVILEDFLALSQEQRMTYRFLGDTYDENNKK